MARASGPSIAPFRWLVIIGIGEDGIAGLGDDAKRRISEAEFVFGGKRHVDLAGSLIRGTVDVWKSPLDRSIAEIAALRGRAVTVLASGDPFFFGIGATLSRSIDPAEMISLPAPSSFSLAASRLGWPLQDVITLSLHGRPIELIRPHLQPGSRILALTSDEMGPSALAALLTASGFGKSGITVLEALGGPSETLTDHVADTFRAKGINPLNICAIDVRAAADARVLPLTPGLHDSLFEHDGQITKREVRALTLSALAPRRGELLVDIGGGSGSISIEWMLADPAMRAITVEADPQRAARIARNASLFGVPGLQIVEGEAPEALSGLPVADAVFIGGGGSRPGVVESAMDQLRPGGRLVANAVTLEMEAILLARQQQHGGELLRFDIARAAPVGTMTGWRPAMPVTQWIWRKP